MSDKLLKLFNITAEDIEANQSGVLTDTQLQQLKNAKSVDTSRDQTLILLGLSLGLLMSLVGGAIVAYTLNGLLVLLPGLYFLLISLATWRRFHKTWHAYQKDIENPQVKWVEGSIKLAAQNKSVDVNMHTHIASGYSWDYFVRIGTTRYKINQKQFYGLEKDKNYRVYYTSHALLVVNMVLLDNDNDGLSEREKPKATVISPLFDPFSIEANEQGHLTESQQEEIDHYRQGTPYFLFFFFSLYAILTPFIALRLGAVDAIIIIVGFTILTVTIYTIINQNRYIIPANPDVLKHFGIAYKTSYPMGRPRNKNIVRNILYVLLTPQFIRSLQYAVRLYIVRIDDKDFKTHRQYFDQFINGRKYCVYYIAETNLIVSAEEVFD